MHTLNKLTDFLTQTCQTLEAIAKLTQSILAITAASVSIHKVTIANKSYAITFELLEH